MTRVYFKIDDREVREAIQELKRRYPTKVKKVIAEAAVKIQSSAKRNLRALHAIDTGRLRNSIGIELFNNGLTAEIGSKLSYAVYVEFGAIPHWPPLGEIELWAKRHGIPAFLVARAIARRGLPPRPYLLPAFDEHKGWLIQALRRIGAER